MSSIDRASLEARMRDQGLEPAAWSSLAGTKFWAHTHDYDTVVGPKGVTCLEAHLPAGTMGTRAKGRGYRW